MQKKENKRTSDWFFQFSDGARDRVKEVYGFQLVVKRLNQKNFFGITVWSHKENQNKGGRWIHVHTLYTVGLLWCMVWISVYNRTNSISESQELMTHSVFFHGIVADPNPLFLFGLESGFQLQLFTLRPIILYANLGV